MPWTAHTTQVGAQRMVASITKSTWSHQHQQLRERWRFVVETRDRRAPTWSSRSDGLRAVDRLVVDADPVWVADGARWFESVPEAVRVGGVANGDRVGIYLTHRRGVIDPHHCLGVEVGRGPGHLSYSTIDGSLSEPRTHRSYLADMIEAATRPSWHEASYIPDVLLREVRDVTVGPLLGSPGTAWCIDAAVVREAVLTSDHVLDLRHLNAAPSRHTATSGSAPKEDGESANPRLVAVVVDESGEGRIGPETSAPAVPDRSFAPVRTQHSGPVLSNPLAVLDNVLDSNDALADLRGSVAASTWRSYRADLRDYADFCTAQHQDWSKPATIVAYLHVLAAAGAAYATIERRQTSIAKLHEARAVLGDVDVDDPTKHPKVRTALKRLRRELGTDQDRATPLTGERLIQVLHAIDTTTTTGLRDTALLLIGWYGAFRRSELAGMRRKHLTIDDHGIGIALPRSKGAQDHTVFVPIMRNPGSRFDPLAALETWLEELDQRLDGEQGIWLRISRGDNVVMPTTPISGDAINSLVIRRVLAAGLDGAAGYSAHSLRSGFITEAKNRAIDEADIMKHSRHKSLAQMRLYDRTSGWWQRNATASMGL